MPATPTVTVPVHGQLEATFDDEQETVRMVELAAGGREAMYLTASIVVGGVSIQVMATCEGTIEIEVSAPEGQPGTQDTTLLYWQHQMNHKELRAKPNWNERA